MNKFLNRIYLERKALKLINSNSNSNELAGLTRLAIDVWRENTKGLDMIIPLVLVLSEKLSLINERSGERFTAEYELNSEECELVFKKLEKALLAAK
jgi:hypothetical protein